MKRKFSTILLMVTVFASATAYGDDVDLATADFEYAKVLGEKGFYDLAMTAYQDAVKLHKDHAGVEEGLVAIADLNVQMGKLDEALQGYENFLKKHAYSKYALRAEFGIGEVLYEKGDYEGALKKFRRIAEGDEDTASDAYIRASYNVCWCQLKLGRYAEAAKGFQEFAVVYAGLGMATESWLALGECYLKMNKPADALDAFSKARSVTKDPSLVMRASYGLGRALYEAKKYNEAKIAFTDLLKRAGDGPYAPLAMWWEGLCYAGAGDLRNAISTLNELMKKYRNTSYADQALDKIAELSRGSASWLLTEAQRFALAEKEYEAGNYEAAIQRYKQLLASHPTGEFAAKSQRSIARCLVKMGKPNEAAEALMQTAEKFPKDPIAPECIIEAASLYASAKNSKGQQAAFSKLGKDYPEFGKGDRIKYTLAALKFNDQQYLDAAAMFQELVRSFPKSTLRESSMFRAAYCTYLAGESKKTIQLFDSFVSEFPQSEETGQAYYFKAEALQKLNRDGEAVSAYNRCLVASPTPELAGAAHYQIAVLLEKGGKIDEARKEYETAVATYPQASFAPNAKLRAAMLYYQLKKPDECRVALLELRRDYPDFSIPAVTLDWLTEDLMGIGDTGKAIELAGSLTAPFEKALEAAEKPVEEDLGGVERLFEQDPEAVAKKLKEDLTVVEDRFEEDVKEVRRLVKEDIGAAKREFDERLVPVIKLLGQDAEAVRNEFDTDLDEVEKLFAEDRAKYVQRAYCRRGRGYMKEGKWQDALTEFHKGVDGRFAASPLVPQAKLDMAQALVQMREYSDAILLLQDLAGATTGDLALEVQYEMAEIFKLQGKTADAARVLERATILPGKLNNNDWLIKVYVELGELKERELDTQGAIDAYGKAVGLDTLNSEMIELKNKARDRRRELERTGR